MASSSTTAKLSDISSLPKTIDKLLVPELKDELQKRGLDTSGLRADLTTRLSTWFEEQRLKPHTQHKTDAPHHERLPSNDAVEVANAVKTAQGDPMKIAEKMKDMDTQKAMEGKPVPEPQTAAPDVGAVKAIPEPLTSMKQHMGLNQDPSIPSGSNPNWNPTVDANTNITPTTAPVAEKTSEDVAMKDAPTLEKKDIPTDMMDAERTNLKRPGEANPAEEGPNKKPRLDDLSGNKEELHADEMDVHKFFDNKKAATQQPSATQ
jgi:hypothetical protein